MLERSLKGVGPTKAHSHFETCGAYSSKHASYDYDTSNLFLLEKMAWLCAATQACGLLTFIECVCQVCAQKELDMQEAGLCIAWENDRPSSAAPIPTGC
jgi:hypothetical protein